MFDLRYWRCVLRRTNKCPVSDVKIFLYTKYISYQYRTAISRTLFEVNPISWWPLFGLLLSIWRHHIAVHIVFVNSIKIVTCSKSHSEISRKRIDVLNPKSLDLCGWDESKKNAIIIHGFNGSEGKEPMNFIRKEIAYLKRGDYNVFTVDWKPLTQFPCYLSALQNTRLVSQCAAQFYSYLTNHGVMAKNIVCIGHSLGAHVCGMMTSHLDKKQSRIIGLDPARPLINRFARKEFKLSTDDAYNVQIIHSNAGFLGEVNQIGHVDFCINGGQYQPGCYGHKLRQSRCSHFQAVCYLAHTVKTGNNLLGYPCTTKCPRRRNTGILPGQPIPLGEETPDEARGMYCVEFSHNKNCPFD